MNEIFPFSHLPQPLQFSHDPRECRIPLSVGMHFLYHMTPFAWKVPPLAKSVVFECRLMSRYRSFHFDLTQPGLSLLCMIVLHWNGHSSVLLSMIFIFGGQS